MKKLFMALLASAALYQAAAAEGEWLTDFTKATEKAKAENKLVLMDFTGSDYCPPCKALFKNVFSTAEFVEYAKKNLVLVEVDFPIAKKQSDELKKANAELEKKFKVDGYPTIILLDSNGKELSRDAGYGGEKPKEFIARIEALKKK